MKEWKLLSLQSKQNLNNIDVRNYYKTKFKNLRKINYVVKKRSKEIYQINKSFTRIRCNGNYDNNIKLNLRSNKKKKN